MLKALIHGSVVLPFFLSLPFIALAQENYVYERMWPPLKQPSYFRVPARLDIDKAGNIYIAVTYNGIIQKFTSREAMGSNSVNYALEDNLGHERQHPCSGDN